MKKYTILFIAFLFSLSGAFAQLVQGTIINGSMPNSVYLQIKSDVTITNAFIGAQFSIGIPTGNPTLPTTATATGSIPGYAPSVITGTYTTQGGYRIFAFDPNNTQPAGGSQTYTAGVTYTIAEITFTGGGFVSAPSGTALLQLANGGTMPNDFIYFYVNRAGADVTNVPAQFFSTTGGVVTNGGTADYSAIASVTLGAGVVPVRLTSFNAVKNNQDAFVSWTVENQDANADRFEVERSFNGTDFKFIGMTDANDIGGNISYNYTDRNITSLKGIGIIYYRLKSIDKNGTFVYSQTRNIRLEAQSFALNLYPNPAATYTNLSFELQEASKISVFVRDAAGKTVRTVQVTGVKGMNQQKIDVSALASGRYNVTLQTGGKVQTLSFLKSN